MFKLLALLCAGLFLTLLIAGRDHGQTRLGLSGAYDIAALRPLPAAADAAPAAELIATERRAPAAAAPQDSEGEATPAAFTAAPVLEGAQGGLTLALPLATPAARPVAETVAEAPAPDTGPAQLGYVIGSSVNVREGPSARAAVVGRLSRGEAVLVLGEGEPGWSLVRIEGDGLEGYIATRYLAVSPPGDGLFPASD